MVDESLGEGNATEFANEMSHNSNAEKRVDVDTPQRMHPQRRTGIDGTGAGEGKVPIGHFEVVPQSIILHHFVI